MPSHLVAQANASTKIGDFQKLLMSLGGWPSALMAICLLLIFPFAFGACAPKNEGPLPEVGGNSAYDPDWERIGGILVYGDKRHVQAAQTVWKAILDAGIYEPDARRFLTFGIHRETPGFTDVEIHSSNALMGRGDPNVAPMVGMFRVADRDGRIKWCHRITGEWLPFKSFVTWRKEIQ